jgi:hypothetical protein
MHCFRHFQIEDRTQSNLQMDEKLSDRMDFYLLKKVKFISEQQPYFAICVFGEFVRTSLGVLEVDLENGKLIVHQMFELNVEGKYV